MKTNLLILALLVMSSGVMAQTKAIWEPDGDRAGVGAWANPDNWSGGVVPGDGASGDEFRVLTLGDGEIVVSADVSVEEMGFDGTYSLELGDNKDDGNYGGSLTIEDGGHVETTRETRSMIGTWSPARLTVEEGGSLYIGAGQDLIIGSNKDYSDGADAQMGSEVNLNGGTITVEGEFGIDFFDDKEFSGGTMYIKGGTLILTDPDGWFSLDDGVSSIGSNGKIEYTDGLMQLAGDHEESLEAYETEGRLTGEFDIVVDSTDTENKVTYLGNDVGQYTSINSSVQEEKASVSPNPADDYLNVSLGNDVIQSVQIIDLSGRVADSFEYGNVKEATIQLQGVAKGIYIVKIKGKESSDFEKVIIR